MDGILDYACGPGTQEMNFECKSIIIVALCCLRIRFNIKDESVYFYSMGKNEASEAGFSLDFFSRQKFG